MKNKTYIIYSLIVPLLYIAMVFVNYAFGMSFGDVISKPYGTISDVVTGLITVLYLLLLIGNVVLFFINYKEINIKNMLMIIANSIFGFLMMVSAYTAWVLVCLVIGFIAGGFLFVIGYFVLCYSQIKELIKSSQKVM